MTRGEDDRPSFDVLDLTEYGEQALSQLIATGRTTAPDLSEATGIPKARIYGVLDALADAGYIKVIPGRPKQYQPKPPGEILNRAVENRRQAYRSYEREIEDQRDRFIETFRPMFESGTEEVSPTEELFHVVDVGEPSERETRSLYRQADETVRVLTKSFEYFEAVEPAVADALDRGCRIQALLLAPAVLESKNHDVQAERVKRLRADYPSIEVRFSRSRLPWRGTIVDPSMEYDSGQAILLVEEENVPLYKRQAAVTSNPSFVAGLGRYFELAWEYDTLEEDPY